MNNAERIAHIKEIGKRAQGRKELLKHLASGKLTALSAIKAHCYSCQGFYASGIEDCRNTACPLYPFNPYNPNARKVTRRKRPGQKPPEPKVKE